MSKNSTQYEVLFLTGTSFSSRKWQKRDEADKRKNLTDKEQLEEACWNGLLPEIFPEIFRESTDLKSLYLWQIKQAQSFLEIEMGESPASKDYYFSIDPYCFLKQQYLS